MIGKLFEVLIPFFLQLALGFAVLGWIVNEDEKKEERRKRRDITTNVQGNKTPFISFYRCEP